MPKRYFNWKLAVVLIVGLGVLFATAYGVRKWQKSNRAENALEIGNRAYEEKRWEEAVENLGRYLSVESGDVSALLKYAEAQLNIRPLKSDNIKQAGAAYRTILRVEKGNSEAATRLTGMYLSMGIPGEAELIARRALETNQDPELRRLLALALAHQRKFEQAATELEEVIKNHPDQILAYEALWQLIRQRPEISTELPQLWLDRAVDNNPSSALAYIVRANYYFNAGDNASALADLEKAEKQDLSDPVVRLRLAGGFIDLDILDKAEKHLMALQALEPTNQVLWQMWAQLALKSGSVDKMEKVAERGLRELSYQPWDFMPMATELFIRCNKLDSADDCISKLNQKDIDPAKVAFLEGLVAEQRGRSSDVVKCWRRAIQLGEKSPRIRLALASTLSSLGDTQSALRELNNLVSENPDLFEARLELARLLARIGDWDRTSEHARKAMQLSPENLEATLLYLQAQIQLLATSSTGGDDKLWRDIKERLSILERTTNGSSEVKIVQLQLAIEQHDFLNAEALIIQLKEECPAQLKIALAEVELLVSQNETGEAILTLNSIIEKFPDEVEPVKYLALLLNSQGDYKKCEAVIKDALVRIETPVAERKLGLLLARLYAEWGQQNNAYELLDTLAIKLPNDIPVKRQLLTFDETIKNPEKAQKIVNDIRFLEGDSGWQWRYEQAKLWFGADDFEDKYSQIISLLKENLLTNPDDQASRMLLAATYERIGNLQIAISIYGQALDRSPQDLRIIISMVSALYRAKEYDQADKILSSVAAEKLYHPKLQKLQLQSYLRHGQLDSASDIMDDLLSNDPNDKAIALSLAVLKIQQNEFYEAGKLLDELKIQDPNALPVTVAQIRLNIRQGKPEEAMRLCNEAVDNINNASAYILRAKTYATLEQTDKAKEDFEYATVIEPNSIEAWVAKSDFYRFMGQSGKAIADIEHALSLASDNLGIQKRAIPLFLGSGDMNTIEQGKVILDKALESNPEDVELRLYKASLLMVEDKVPAIEEAIEILSKITEDQPEVSGAWVRLGELMLRQGQFADAMDTVLRGLIHKPSDTKLLLLKARIEAARSPALAVPTLKALLDLEPSNIEVAIRLAGTYIAVDEQEKAVELLRRQLNNCKDEPARRKCNIALASALYKSGNKQEAEKLFDLLYESIPDESGLLLTQVAVFREDGRYTDIMTKVTDWFEDHPKNDQILISIAGDLIKIDDPMAMKTAEKILRMVIAHAPENTNAMLTLAILLQKIGQSSEAVELNQKIIALQPDSVIAMNNLAWIMCEEQGKYRQALELAEKGLQIAPQYVDLIDTRGVAYYHLGKFEEAIKDFTACIELYPTQASGRVSSYFHLARAFAGMGERDKAIENLKHSLDLENQVGGLSKEELDEAQSLLKALSEGN